MLINKDADPIDIRAGVYKHYKGPLYQVIGYSHNASDENNMQVLYIGLELDSEKVGPRWATRNWREFFATVCPTHQGIDAYSKKHDAMFDAGPRCNADNWQERFQYMGPVYYKGFES